MNYQFLKNQIIAMQTPKLILFMSELKFHKYRFKNTNTSVTKNAKVV